jgi:hypothetical protein
MPSAATGALPDLRDFSAFDILLCHQVFQPAAVRPALV